MTWLRADSGPAWTAHSVRQVSPPAAPEAAGPQALPDGWKRWVPRGRSLRVICLVVGIVAMSVADLHLTIVHLSGPGMSEANPLARWVMQMNCAWVLSAWKLMLVGLTGGILIMLRRRGSAELAAWAGFCVLALLMVHWMRYAAEVNNHADMMPIVASVHEANWVRFE